MTVAIVHYHLQPGGVTQVIRAASRALGETGIRHVVLTGAACPSFPAPAREIPALGYGAHPEVSAEVLAADLVKSATESLGDPPDLWHFHNHSLGKNAILPRAVAILADSGARILLQIHDLAENGRPENFPLIAGIPHLYPHSPSVRLAFLNRRDMEILICAGLPREHAIILPNPVSVPEIAATPPSHTILFAPIRGIRRKNLGELVLFAALAPAGAAIATSRPPRDPAALAIHETWQAFATRHRLPIALGATDRFSPVPGAAATFEAWLAHASHIVTTSVSEGYGLPFVEAAALRKPLIGRRLGHLTEIHGLSGARLYDRINIPVDWVDRPLLQAALVTTLERNYRLLHRRLPQTTVAEIMDFLVRDGLVDFANLPEPLQQGVIERLVHPAERAVPQVVTAGKSEPLVDWLAAALADRAPTTAAPMPDFAKSLLAAYRDLLAQPAGPVRHVPPAAVLDAHLAPGSFHFLLSAPPPAAPRAPFRAVVFDIYGTLLDCPPGGVRADPAVDPALREILENLGHSPPDSPSAALHAAVLRHHAASTEAFPEVDLRQLWREILGLPDDAETGEIVAATEAICRPAVPVPGAADFVAGLARAGISLGLLSNAQSNTLADLGPLLDFFPPELTILSFRHGIAKPSPALFQILADRLAGRRISPQETLFIGNDPDQDIAPARAAGFRTALFRGGEGSLANFTFRNWPELARWMRGA